MVAAMYKVSQRIKNVFKAVLVVYILVFAVLHGWGQFKTWNPGRSLEHLQVSPNKTRPLHPGLLAPTQENIRRLVFNSQHYKPLAPRLDTDGDIVLTYKEFNTAEPSFVSKHDRHLFLANSQNVRHLASPSPDRLTGLVTVFNGGVAHDRIDCSCESDLSLFRNRSGQSFDQPARLEGVIVPLLVPGSSAFQHFLDGSLPKIIQILPLIHNLDLKLLLLKPRDKIIYHMLYHLGIPEGKLLYYSDYAPHSYQGVKTESQLNTCITPPVHPFLWQKAAELLRGIQQSSPASKVILLTRSHSYNGGRRIVNRRDVVTSLRRRYGDDFLLFRAGYNLKQTQRIFGSARVVIGVHGGAFYNMFFASPNTTFVELMPTMPDGGLPKLSHTIVWRTARSLGQRYWRISMTPQNSLNDVSVDVRLLQKVLDIIH